MFSLVGGSNQQAVWFRSRHLPRESSELEAEEGDLVKAVQSSISMPILQATDVGGVASLIRYSGCAGTETRGICARWIVLSNSLERTV